MIGSQKTPKRVGPKGLTQRPPAKVMRNIIKKKKKNPLLGPFLRKKRLSTKLRLKAKTNENINCVAIIINHFSALTSLTAVDRYIYQKLFLHLFCFIFFNKHAS